MAEPQNSKSHSEIANTKRLYASNFQEDEISLVDLVVIVITHIKLFLFTFIALVLASTIYLVNSPKNFEVSSFLDIGTAESGDPLESAVSLSIKLNRGLIPNILLKIENDSGNKLNVAAIEPFDPESTLIQLKSHSSQESIQMYKDAHRAIFDEILHRHALYLDTQRQSLKQNITELNHAINLIENKGMPAPSNLYESRSEASLSLSKINNSRVGILGQVSQNPVGVSKKLLLFCAVFFSFLISIFLTFSFEFTLKVKEAING